MRNDQQLRKLRDQVPVLITESAADFDALRRSLEEDLTPSGALECIYVQELAELTWEITRFRRAKTMMINAQFRTGLELLLTRVLAKPEEGVLRSAAAKEARVLAYQWFVNAEAKKKVSEILAAAELDESAISAEALRAALKNVESVDRILTSLEVRRQKALGCVANIRQVFGKELRAKSDQLLDAVATEVPTISAHPKAPD